MEDGTIFVLLFYLIGQPVNEGRIDAIFSRKQDCETVLKESLEAQAKYLPNDKQTQHTCVAWTLINSLDDEPSKPSSFRCGFNLFWHRDCNGKPL